MKANEFVKNFGWSEAKFYLSNAHKDALWVSFDLPEHGIRDIVIYVPDLKQLIESHELVGRYGTTDEAKEYLPMLRMDSYDELKQAIIDVESCQ